MGNSFHKVLQNRVFIKLLIEKQFHIFWAIFTSISHVVINVTLRKFVPLKITKQEECTEAWILITFQMIYFLIYISLDIEHELRTDSMTVISEQSALFSPAAVNRDMET